MTLPKRIPHPLFLTSLCWLAVCSAHGQSTLLNPSFEGDPQDATVPVGWFPCAPGTTPDILSGDGAIWGVFEEASEGETYVGLITRQDGSYESIGQRLSAGLEKGECYTFTIDLAHSDTYASYNGKLKLRVWGAAQKCGKDQLLLETDFIDKPDWETYELTFTAKSTIRYVLFEAHFEDGRFSHRGNILLDNISPVVLCTRAMHVVRSGKSGRG